MRNETEIADRYFYVSLFYLTAKSCPRIDSTDLSSILNDYRLIS